MHNPAQSLQKSRRNVPEPLAFVSPSTELQHLWFQMAAARPVRSLALVPVERDTSMLAVAQSLARVAAAQPDGRVLIVNASLRDCLPPRGPTNRPELAIDDIGSTTGASFGGNCEVIDFSRLPIDDAERALVLAPQLVDYMTSVGKTYTAVLFAVDSVLHEPRGIPLVRSVEAAALCIQLGRTSFAAARRLTELVGRDKVIGTVAIH